MTYNSIADLGREVIRLYTDEQYQQAYDLAIGEAGNFPESEDTILYWRACMLAMLDNGDDALELLEQSHAKGYWYPQRQLEDEPDFDAICDYITYQYVLNSSTLFKNIHKLPPGHMQVIDLADGSVKTHDSGRSDRTASRKMPEIVRRPTHRRVTARRSPEDDRCCRPDQGNARIDEGAARSKNTSRGFRESRTAAPGQKRAPDCRLHGPARCPAAA